MNIVLENDGLRLVNYNNETKYGLDELTFYIPIEYNDIIPIVIVKQDNVYDIVKLKETVGTNKSYRCFICELSPLKITSGNCELSLLIFNNNNERVDFLIGTPFIFISISNENYNFKYLTYAMEQVSKSISVTYENMINVYKNIIEISKLNIEACSRQEKGG